MGFEGTIVIAGSVSHAFGPISPWNLKILRDIDIQPVRCIFPRAYTLARIGLSLRIPSLNGPTGGTSISEFSGLIRVTRCPNCTHRQDLQGKNLKSRPVLKIIHRIQIPVKLFLVNS